jgi:flavin-dependent dehydrogenase
MQNVDLLIIGSGPAGISTALHLLQIDSNWAERMVLIEKAAHPRHKLCGGGVTRLGLEYLKDLGFTLPLPIPQAVVDEARIVYGQRVVRVRGRPQFVVFNRAEFDAYLAEQARQRGAVIHENETVTSLSADDSGVTVHTTRTVYRAQAVVGAGGARSSFRHTLSGHRSPSRVARLLEVIHPAQENAPQFSQRYALFDFTPVEQALQGYFWDFPARVGGQPRFNRGVYDARFAPARPRAKLPQILDMALRDLDVDSQENPVQGHPIHWFSPRNTFSAPRRLLVGDAAGADPLFGEGIAPALGYGRVAASTLQHAFDREDFSFRDYRWRLLSSPVGRYLILRWWVAWWSYRLSGHPLYMHTIWTIGGLLVRLWPKGQPLYDSGSFSLAGEILDPSSEHKY